MTYIHGLIIHTDKYLVPKRVWSLSKGALRSKQKLFNAEVQSAYIVLTIYHRFPNKVHQPITNQNEVISLGRNFPLIGLACGLLVAQK